MFNEEKLAVEIYKNGFSSGYFSFGEALLVAKYFRHTLGYGDARTKSAVLLFCERNDVFFRRVPNMNKIKKIVNKSAKPYVNKSEPICLYEEELNTIRSLTEYKNKKFLFSILVLSKLNQESYLANYRWNDIRTTMHSKISNKNISQLMYQYNTLGLIEPTRYESHKILFSKKEGTVIREINQKDIYNLNSVFVELFGRDTFRCVDCDAEHERKSFNQKRCKTCSEKKERENHKLRNRRYYKNISDGGRGARNI